MNDTFWIVLATLVIVVLVLAFRITTVTVMEYERGLKYSKGKYVGLVQPGRYRVLASRTVVHKADIRPLGITVPAQEVLSQDGMPIKVTIAARFEIADLDLAVNKTQNYVEALYTTLQIAAREMIGSVTLEDLLQKRNEFSTTLQDLAESQVEQFGLKLIWVNVRDIMLPGEMKKVFAQVLKARQEGLASLERVRAETAALRNLANAARLVQANPALIQLRALESISASSGNTFVLGLPVGVVPVGQGTESAATATPASEID